MSTHLPEVVRPEEIFAQYPRYGLFEIEVATLREFGLTARYAPEGGDDHVAVFGLKQATSSVKEKLAKRIVRAWEPGTQQLCYERGLAEPPRSR